MSLGYFQGTILNRVGGGSGTGLLDTTYRPGFAANGIACTLIGRVRAVLTITKGGATDVRIRAMDYSDPSNPRVLQSIDTALDGGASKGEQTYSADTKTELTIDLQGTITALAIEVKFTGSGDGSTSAKVDLYLVELPR